jgi:hypothetical protein
LLPGAGLKAIYNTPGDTQLFLGGNVLFSVLGNVIFTY